MKKLIHYDFEQLIKVFLSRNSSILKLFFIALLISVVIYGQKLFFTSLSPDDYGNFFSAGRERASWNGRWMGGILSQTIFSHSMQILPYLHSFLGILSFTLAGILTAKFLNLKNSFEILIVTLLISINPYFSHSLFFNISIIAWLGVLLGVVAIIFAYMPNRTYKIFGFILLTVSIGIYQTIIQVVTAIIMIKAVIDLLEVKNKDDIINVLKQASFYVIFVLLAFVASTIINHLYMEYNNLIARGRYKKAGSGLGISIIIDRLSKMYHTNLGHIFFKKQYEVLYYLMILLSTWGIITTIYKQKKSISIKTTSLFLISFIFICIPIVIFLPQIVGNPVSTRAHITIGWIVAGFFVFQSLSLSGALSLISRLLVIFLIILNVYYINIFFYAANRQTSSDISRANQIVNRIRINDNYLTEPMQFKIIGRKPFNVEGSRSKTAMNREWSKYNVFKHFTDFKFTAMKDDRYTELKKHIIQKGEKIYPYPGKNSIVIYENAAFLFLNSQEINKEMELVIQ